MPSKTESKSSMTPSGKNPTEAPVVYTRLGPTTIEVGVTLPLSIVKQLTEPQFIKVVESFVQELAEASLTCQLPTSTQQSPN